MRTPHLLLLLALARSGFAADVGGHLENARQVSEKLRAAPKPDDISNDARVPDPVPELLSELKREIRYWLTEQLAASPADVQPSALSAEIQTELTRASLFTPNGGDENNPFGSILDINVSPAPNEADLLKVVVSYSSFCPPDDSVLLFQRKAGRWQLVLNFDNTDFTHPWGDRAILYAGVSPRDEQGQYYLLVVRTRSYCPMSGSDWNNINYHILRPGTEALSPKSLLSGEHGFHAEEQFRVRLGPKMFTMEFPDASLSPIILVRTLLLNYAVSGDEAHRIEPVAANPEHFVEEWLSRPWDEAREWSDQAKLTELHQVHDKRPSLGDLPLIQYCSGDRKLMQISFPVEDDPGPGSKDERFTVQEMGANLYRMVEVSTRQLPGCSAPEPAEKLQQYLLPASLNQNKF
jgi:hypothetical protein